VQAGIERKLHLCGLDHASRLEAALRAIGKHLHIQHPRHGVILDSREASGPAGNSKQCRHCAVLRRVVYAAEISLAQLRTLNVPVPFTRHSGSAFTLSASDARMIAMAVRAKVHFLLDYTTGAAVARGTDEERICLIGNCLCTSC
jgi:hypothetical protein